MPLRQSLLLSPLLLLAAFGARAEDLPLPPAAVDPPPCTSHERTFAGCDAAVAGRVVSVRNDGLTVSVDEVVRGRVHEKTVSVPIPPQLAEALDKPGTPVTLLLRRADGEVPGWVLAGGPVRGGAIIWNDTDAIRRIAAAHRDPAAGLRSEDPRVRLAAAYYAALRFRDAARAIEWNAAEPPGALPEAAGLIDALVPGLAPENGRNARAAARDGIEALLLISLNSDPRFRYTVYESDVETLKLRIGRFLEWRKAVGEEWARLLAQAKPAAGAAGEAHLRRLITELGDRSWNVRDAAHRELAVSGPAAARLLALAVHSADLERATRATKILAGLCEPVVAGDPAAFRNVTGDGPAWPPDLAAIPFLKPRPPAPE